ncbi:MAG: GNAT family N-acetyltransferase [Candidatus Thorarchaeota archaeon]
MDIKIRKALVNDAENLSNIWKVICAEKIYSAVDRAFTPQEERDYLLSLTEREVVYIAEVEGKVVGFQTLDLWSKVLTSTSHVGTIGTFILPEYRGMNIGNSLAKQTFKFARANLYEKIMIYIRNGNEKAIKFYQNLGFIKKGELKRQVKIDNNYEDELFMEKFL